MRKIFWYRTSQRDRYSWYIGLLKKFQGFGIMISDDNPITYSRYFLFEIRFLWLKCWFTYYYKSR